MSDEPSATPRGARPRSRAARRRPSTTNLTIRVGALSAAATLVIGAGLAVQMANGADPALGPKAQVQAASSTASTASTTSTGSTIGDSSSSSDESSSSLAPAVSQPTPVTTRVS
jgi:hypothetical protein